MVTTAVATRARGAFWSVLEWNHCGERIVMGCLVKAAGNMKADILEFWQGYLVGLPSSASGSSLFTRHAPGFSWQYRTRSAGSGEMCELRKTTDGCTLGGRRRKGHKSLDQASCQERQRKWSDE